MHTPEDLELAIELRDKHRWTASLSIGKSNPKAGKMKEIQDRADQRDRRDQDEASLHWTATRGQRGKGSKVEANLNCRPTRALSKISFIFLAFGLLLPVLKKAVHWCLLRSSIANSRSSGVCTYALVHSLTLAMFLLRCSYDLARTCFDP